MMVVNVLVLVPMICAMHPQFVPSCDALLPSVMRRESGGAMHLLLLSLVGCEMLCG